MRTLIVGAGVAGLTLAARLEQQGQRPVIVERATDLQGGYAIGLYPLGSCVLHGLGLYRDFLARGSVVTRYELADHRGRVLQSVDMSRLTGEISPMIMLARADLLAVLINGCRRSDLRYGTTVTNIAQTDDTVDVSFNAGVPESFDLVVACDGMGSTMRELVFGAQSGFDSGWLLHTWSASAERFPADVAKEWWGRGSFFGAYPAPQTVMCAAGGPAASLTDDTNSGDARPLLRTLLAELAAHDASVASALDDAIQTHEWPMRDVRAVNWVRGRVALCGDAAAAFLPTAGVGASNAMRAAAGLADELSRCDATTVPLALQLYEKRCRSLIERNQTESRRLARLMFLRSSALTWARDQLAHRYPAERMLGQIIDSMRTPF